MKKIIIVCTGILTVLMASSFRSGNEIKSTPVKKKVLIIGIDPKLIDFSSPEYAAFPGLTAEKVEAGVKAQQAKLNEIGYEAEVCWVDFGATALSVIEEKLKSGKFDGILIGAGIRVPNTNFILFEKIVNVAHEKASKARIFFNTNPKDIVEATQRWL